jgi:hypothetical protein
MSKSKQFVRGGMLCLLGVALLLSFSTARSQGTLENALEQFSGDAVKGYMQPAADLFGANMNSGFYHSAQMSRWGLHLSLDIVGMAAMVGDEQKTFDAPTPAGFTPAKFKTATIFGGKGTEISDATMPALKYKGSDGVLNTSTFPLATPQLTIGYVFGTEAIVRYVFIPKIGEDAIPASKLWGVGVRHSISQYVPSVPVDLAVGFFYQSYTAGDLVDFKGYTYGVQASKSFSILTIYGGLSAENSTLKLHYTSTDPLVPGTVDVSLDGANKVRFTGGLCLTLGFAKIFADANFGSVTCFSGGIGFGN